MDIKQIQELVKLINKTNIGEITIEEEGVKITVKQKKDPVQHIIAVEILPLPILRHHHLTKCTFSTS
jgi:acetyl-CoA carboxylase biotin carboxyl carrier protein